MLFTSAPSVSTHTLEVDVTVRILMAPTLGTTSHQRSWCALIVAQQLGMEIVATLITAISFCGSAGSAVRLPLGCAGERPIFAMSVMEKILGRELMVKLQDRHSVQNVVRIAV